MIRDLIAKYKIHWAQKEFVNSAILGAALFVLSLFITYIASNFAARKASSGVTDIILDNIPVLNLGLIFIWGAVLLFIIVIVFLVYEPRYLPFTLKSLALFYIVRSLLMTLTHIGPYYESAVLPPNWIINWTLDGGLFFSGHTGMPFLLALIFWRYPKLRLASIAISIIFGISVLFSHIHYSIDVVAAFFITYAIFEMAKNFFPKSYKLTE